MKKFSFKAVALAAGLLAGGSAFAVVDITGTAAATGTVTFASERNVSSGVTLTNTAHAMDVSVKIGVDVANAGAVMSKFIRFDLSSGTFTAAPTVTIGTSKANAEAGTNKALLTNTQIVAGGAGSSYVVFQIDFTNAVASDLDSTDYATLFINGVDVTDQNAITVKYGLYALVGLATAANPNATLASDDGELANFGAALKITSTNTTVTANYDNTVPFSQFVAAAASGSNPATTAKVAGLGNLGITLNAGVLLPATGAVPAAITDIVTTGAIVTVTGDFSAVKKKSDGTLDPANVTFNGVAATTLTATTATFGKTGALTTIDGNNDLLMTVDGGVAVAAGSYKAAYDFTGATGYTVADQANVALGTIVRNGTTLVAPLVNQPAGWYSRLVLTSTSGAAMGYKVAAVAEDGTTVALTGAAASGTVKANSTLVIDLDALTTITGTGAKPRTGLVVTVDGAAASISGLYQLANGATSNVSNYPLIVK